MIMKVDQKAPSAGGRNIEVNGASRAPRSR